MNFSEIKEIRSLFPILSKKIYDKPLVYFDNAATTQKPLEVIEEISYFYKESNANIHRGVHYLSSQATTLYEEARQKVARFLNTRSEKEIIFVRGTTEAINLVMQTFGRMRKGSSVVITGLEHHSNIVPWKMLCEEKNLNLKVIPVLESGDLDVSKLESYLTQDVRILALTHISNAIGTVNNISNIIELSHQKKIPVLIDGAQATAHKIIDVQKLDCDFYTLSGHKMYGPSGIGVLYGKYDLLSEMPPYQGGGDMIESVSFEEITYQKPPYKFEAGTPHLSGPIALSKAIDFLQNIGLEKIAQYENTLLNLAKTKLDQVDRVKRIGNPKMQSAIISFIVEGIHPHDLGTVLDREAIAIRTGHHCAQPLIERFGLNATSRISLAVYNTEEEIDLFIEALKKVIKLLG